MYTYTLTCVQLNNSINFLLFFLLYFAPFYINRKNVSQPLLYIEENKFN